MGPGWSQPGFVGEQPLKSFVPCRKSNPAAPENEMNTIRCYDRYTNVKRLAALIGIAAGIALGLLAR